MDLNITSKIIGFYTCGISCWIQLCFNYTKPIKPCKLTEPSINLIYFVSQAQSLMSDILFKFLKNIKDSLQDTTLENELKKSGWKLWGQCHVIYDNLSIAQALVLTLFTLKIIPIKEYIYKLMIRAILLHFVINTQTPTVDLLSLLPWRDPPEYFSQPQQI